MKTTSANKQQKDNINSSTSDNRKYAPEESEGRKSSSGKTGDKSNAPRKEAL